MIGLGNLLKVDDHASPTQSFMFIHMIHFHLIVIEKTVLVDEEKHVIGDEILLLWELQTYFIKIKTRTYSHYHNITYP